MEKKSNNNSVRHVGSNVKRKNTTNKNVKGKKKHPRLKKVIIIFALLIVLLVLVAVGIFCGIFFSDKFALSKDDLLLSNANTVIYDKDGNVIAELSGDENREIISIGDMSEYLPKAFVAIEDERFYEHKGVDIISLTRSLLHNILSDTTQGGSTIEMQISKNLLTSDDRTMKRKIKDIYYATQMDKFMTKDEILCTYLNNVYFGKSAYGVGKASKVYFGKNVQDLTLAQSAMLVGITNNPAKYKEHREAKKRQEVILYKMKELGYIDEEEYSQAISEKVPFKSEIE